jgi:hypothetical protein
MEMKTITCIGKGIYGLEMKNKVKVAVTRSRVTDYQNHKYMTIIP